MNTRKSPTHSRSCPLLVVLSLVPIACVPVVEDRVPVVDQPLCILPAEDTRPAPGIVERTPLAATLGCNATFQSSRDVTVTARRADGSLDESDFYVEQRVTAFQIDGACEIHIHTTAWERKLDDLLAVDPIAAQVTLCGARVTTSHATALSSVAPKLRKVDVGFDPADAPAELTTLVGSPQPLSVEDASVEVLCDQGVDGGDASAHVARYAFHHRVVVRMSQEDALRLAWDGVIEMSFDVLYVENAQ